MSYIDDPRKWRISKSGYTIRTGWADEKKIIARAPDASGGVSFQEWLDNAEKICELFNAQLKPADVILFCPNCNAQHIDKAEPDNCQNCGENRYHHYAPTNECKDFTEWLNPPHKSHRCHSCNHVWKPFDYATNGVLETSGQPLENAAADVHFSFADSNTAVSK